MYPHQVERLGQALEREGLRALIATTAANIAYVTGFWSLSQAVYQRTPVFAVYAPTGTALVLPVIDAPAAAAEGVEVDHVITYGEFYLDFAASPRGALAEVAGRTREWTRSPAPTAADALAAALAALDIRSGTVGLDDGQLGYDSWRRASERLAPLTVLPASSDFAEARMVKSPYEIECLERALHIAEESANVVIQMLKPGVTEREAVRRYEEAVAQRGATPYATIIAMGERAALPAAYPSDRALRAGDLIRLDLGCILKGFYSDLARTAVMGEPSERQQRVYEALQAAENAAIDAVAAGALAGTIFRRAIDTAQANGLPGYQRHHVGHGIGLEPYEPPVFERGGDTELPMGAVLRIETPYYEVGWSGMNIKDTVLVIRGGGRVLNRSARGLVVLD